MCSSDLSARLKGVAARMRPPLADLRDKVAAFHAAAAAALTALRAGLKQHAAASAACELLELLLDTSHIVSKVLLFQTAAFLIKRQSG